MKELLPRPNTQALSWFYGEDKSGTLILNPKYQRNPIWSLGQKCFLIDSLISGFPVPQVYINIKTVGTGKKRQTVYEVVDGQQRLRAILEFMKDEWELVKTTARAYPVSHLYVRHIGKKYTQLPEHVQETIWNYPLAVQELRGWDDRQIRALFRRLNYVVERLNRQELRHSQYFGEFAQAVESLAKHPFWDTVSLFSRKDAQRMKDTEFVSELLVLTVDGVQDQQKTLDKFYANFDVRFPRRAHFTARFMQILESLLTIKDVIQDTRFSKKADFYGLFAAVKQVNEEQTPPVNLGKARSALQKLAKRLEGSPERLRGLHAKYHTTVIEGPNKLAKRKLREEILFNLIMSRLGRR